MRISGLSTGIDTETMVKDLMKAQRVSYDKLSQQKQTLDWKREAYRSINSKMVNFRNNKLANYRLESTFESRKPEVLGNTDAVDAKLTQNVATSHMKIEVLELASGARWYGKNSAIDPLDSHLTLDELKQKTGGAFDYVDNSIKINGQIVTFNPSSDTIETLVTKINNKKELGVVAAYSNVTGEFVFTSRQTGVDAEVDVQGSLFSNSQGFVLSQQKDGKNAHVKIDEIEMVRPNNQFLVQGIQLTLKATTGTQPSHINIVQDQDRTVDQVKSFIEDYNDLLKTLNENVQEKKFRDFLPLTEEQRKEMKEEEIKQWEDKAKSGLLRNDSILQKAVQKMRNSISTQDQRFSLSSLGIETGSWNEQGKLYLKDEKKLREALTQKPEQVQSLLIGKTEGKKDGIFHQIYDTLMESIDEIAQKAGTNRFQEAGQGALQERSILGMQIGQVNEKLSTLNKRLLAQEDRYYKQFAAMEKAISKMNAQTSSLFNMQGQ